MKEELRDAILKKRKEKTGSTTGEIKITALYKKIDLLQITAKKNLTKVVATRDITANDQLFVSLGKVSKELHYKAGFKKNSEAESKIDQLLESNRIFESQNIALKAKLAERDSEIQLLKEEESKNATKMKKSLQKKGLRVNLNSIIEGIHRLAKTKKNYQLLDQALKEKGWSPNSNVKPLPAFNQKVKNSLQKKK